MRGFENRELLHNMSTMTICVRDQIPSKGVLHPMYVYSDQVLDRHTVWSLDFHFTSRRDTSHITDIV